jgi:hypothetical protein
MPRHIAITKQLVVNLLSLLLFAGMGFGQSAKINVTANTSRERETKARLEHLIESYNLDKYTFTHDVVIEERTINHAFPVLTLNVRFANSSDELLSSYLHEQLHWYLREHPVQMQDAIAQLRRVYPRVPVGGTEGAETLYSTYGHLIDCYLEIQADRKLIGEQRTMAVIQDKGHYTWIYKTDLEDEARIAAIVKGERLELN